jgi:glycosyltransferase involved in cell wall biosynthesis
MILAAELQMDGFAHLKINAGFIAALSSFDDVTYFGGRDQAANLKRELRGVKGAGFSMIPVFNGYTYSSRVKKEICSVFAVLKLRSGIRRTNPSLVFVLSASPLAKCLLNFLCRKFPVPVIIVCHGELEGLRSISGNPLKQSFWTARFLRNHASNAHPLVMDERVYRNAARCLGVRNIRGSVLFYHPYVFGNSPAERKNPAKTLRICFTGTASAAKGAEKMYALADRLRAEIEAGVIELSFAGSVSPEIRRLSNGLVSMNGDTALVSDTEYSRRISACDMIVFFYSDEQYSLTTSGALFDILDYERPVIALDSGLIREFMDRYGNVGVRAKNIDEMALTIRKIAKNKAKLNLMLKNIIKAKNTWSEEKYAGGLESAMQKAGIKPR